MRIPNVLIGAVFYLFGRGDLMVYLVKSFRISLNPDADFRTVRKPELGIRGESGGGVFLLVR